MLQAVKDLTVAPNSYQLWQLKLAFADTLSHKLSCNLLSPETVLALKQEAVSVLDKVEKDISAEVKSYLSGINFNKCCDDIVARQVNNYVTFYNIPFGIAVNTIDEVLDLCVKLQTYGCSSESISKIMHILGM